MPPSLDTIAAVLQHADSRRLARQAVRSAAHPLDQRPAGPPAGLPRGAEYVRDELDSPGFTARCARPPATPWWSRIIRRRPAKGPHLLFYGHYDVQPVDPLELWHSPPFEPTLIDGPHGKRVDARGAVDDKGQMMMWIDALRAWYEATGGIPATSPR